MTREGFISVVQARGGGDTLVVRARDKEALIRLHRTCGLGADGGIVEGGGSDYPFRVLVGRDEFGSALTRMVDSIDYQNVKEAVRRSRGAKYHDILARCWAVLLDLEGPRGCRGVLMGEADRADVPVRARGDAGGLQQPQRLHGLLRARSRGSTGRRCGIYSHGPGEALNGVAY